MSSFPLGVIPRRSKAMLERGLQGRIHTVPSWSLPIAPAGSPSIIIPTRLTGFHRRLRGSFGSYSSMSRMRATCLTISRTQDEEEFVKWLPSRRPLHFPRCGEKSGEEEAGGSADVPLSPAPSPHPTYQANRASRARGEIHRGAPWCLLGQCDIYHDC